MTYHNTLAHEGEQLRSYEAKAMTQDERILWWLDNMNWFDSRDQGWTPSELNKECLPNAPITSVRRSMNSLTNQGKLIKTDEQRMGPFGRPETVWRLAEPKQEEIDFDKEPF